MKIKPIGDYILVDPDLPEDTVTAAGLIIEATSEPELPNKGVVVALGNAKFSVKVGDHILFKKYGNENIDTGSDIFLLMKESEILSIIETE